MTDFPVLPVSPVSDCLRRLPVRQPDDVTGRVLWLPRLGVSVLAHVPVAEGWLCTLVAADSRPDRLPVGAFVVSHLEVRTAFSTPAAWHMIAALSAAEFADVWRVRAAMCRRSRPMLVNAMIAGLVPDSLTVPIDRRVLRQSDCRTWQGLEQACEHLVTAGLLVVLEPWSPDPPSRPGPPPATSGVAAVVAADRVRGVFGLGLPAPTWPPR